MSKLTNVIFDLLHLHPKFDNAVIEIYTDELEAAYRALDGHQISVAIDALGIFISTTVRDVCAYDESLVKDCFDDELCVDGTTFVALSKFLIQKGAVIDCGTINELPKSVTLHGTGRTIDAALNSLQASVASDKVIKNRKVSSAHFTFYTILNNVNLDYLAFLAGCSVENLEISVKDSKESKTGVIVDLTLDLDYPVYKD